MRHLMVEVNRKIDSFDDFSDKLLEMLRPRRYLKINGFVSAVFFVLNDSLVLISYDGDKMYIDIQVYGDSDPVELLSKIGSFDKKSIVVHYVER